MSREDEHLLAVRKRLLGDDCAGNTDRLQHLLADDIGIDRLESFGAKFGRMHDTVVDKLVPTLLTAAGERVAAAIDNLLRMERLALVESADDWLEMRGLRNRLVHEYIDRPEDLAAGARTGLPLHRPHASRFHRDAGFRSLAFRRRLIEAAPHPGD